MASAMEESADVPDNPCPIPHTGSKSQSATEESSGDGDGSEDNAVESEQPTSTVRQRGMGTSTGGRPAGLPPDANMEDLITGERAALITIRRRRVTALQRIAEQLADQAAEESRAAERAE
ncbi:UNVERIFIED_CONTAM: hypothetical protein K2H54_066455 [Gekko kuhli]